MPGLRPLTYELASPLGDAEVEVAVTDCGICLRTVRYPTFLQSDRGDTASSKRQDHGAVLVQREMETCRSPLASIQPFSAGQFGGERRCSDGEWTKAGC